MGSSSDDADDLFVASLHEKDEDEESQVRNMSSLRSNDFIAWFVAKIRENEKDEDEESQVRKKSSLSRDDDDGVLHMTEEEDEEYSRAMAQSQGFDVPAFPGVYAFGLIIPMSPSLMSVQFDLLQLMTRDAIKHYNKQNDTNFELVNIVKCNHQAVSGLLYYITFNVKPSGASPESSAISTFQAQVLYGTPAVGIVVQFCRPKPPTRSTVTDIYDC